MGEESEEEAIKETGTSRDQRDYVISLTFKVKFLLFCSHTHVSFANYYRRLQKFNKSAGQNSTSALEVRVQDDRKWGEQDLDSVDRKWDWRGVPELWPVARLYSHLSTSRMIFTLVKTLLCDRLFRVAHQLTGYPGHCVILGRFVFHPTIAGLAAFCLSGFHIVWRYVQYNKPVNMMSLFAFLLQSERDLEQFYGIMRANHRGDYLGTGTGTGTGDPLVHEQAARVSEEEQFFRHILCYEVHLASGRVAYKLRPNRKRHAYAHLAAHTSKLMTAATCFYVCLAIPVSVAVILLLLSDLRYVQTFPGCSPPLDHLYTSGQLISPWSWTFTWHRAWAFVFDFVENGVILIDTGLAVSFVVAMSYLASYDILVYLHHLNARIRVELARVRLQCEREQLCNHMRGPEVSDYLKHERVLIEVGLNELQCEIIDFFQQVEQADEFISDVLSTIVCIWLVLVVGPYYYYLSRVSGYPAFPPVVRLIQSIGFFLFTLATLYLLQLHSNCRRSHQMICSLMAYDQSTGSTRRKFMKILEFFTYRKAMTYKIFQRIPYLATTYLTLIGWSFSSMVICDSLFGRERHLSANAGHSQHDNELTPPNGVLILGGSKYSAFSSSL